MSPYECARQHLNAFSTQLNGCTGMSGHEQAEEALARLEVAFSQMFAFTDEERDEATQDRMRS